MKLVILFGPPAVGKMTVAWELARITGLKLFHNHMSLELVNQFFDFGTPAFERLDRIVRFAIFEEVAKSELPGLIFTFVWALNEPEDEQYIDEIVDIFKAEGAAVHFVELKAELEERLKRNRHEDRLRHKPSKRNVDFSEKVLLHNEKAYRMNTVRGDLPDKAVLTIENTNLSAVEAAEMIKQHYQL